MARFEQTKPNVLITGTSTGIGRACALRLAKHGCHVFASVRRHEDGDALVADAEGEITPLVFDVTDHDARIRAVDQIRQSTESDGLFALINNAGALSAGPLEFLTIENIRYYLELNLISAIALTQLCIPLLRPSKGRIVNIGSSQDLFTPPYFGAYTIAKWGMRGFHQALRLELRPSGIQCVLVVPGAIKTSIWKDVPRIEEDLKAISARAAELYGDLARAVQTGAASLESRGLGPEKVAEAIELALTAKRPKPEVIIGKDAKYLMRPLGLLPTRIREAISAVIFKLP